MEPSTSSPIEAGIARSLLRLGEGEAAHLARLLAPRISAPRSAEASLRIAPDGSVRGGRMMLERVDAELARSVAEALTVPWVGACEALVGAADTLGLPLIVGWDLGRQTPLFKLYANASDASKKVRHELVRVLGASIDDAHLLGVNVGEGVLEWKAYQQSRLRDDIRDAARLPSALAAVDAVAWVASYDLSSIEEPHRAPRLRALFAAPAPSAQGRVAAAIHALTGSAWETLRATFPFVPGPIRQIGWAPSGDITMYAKALGAAGAPEALSPTAVFARDELEVGLFLEGLAAPRAYARTARHALTLRVRHGQPSPRDLDLLGRWATRRVEQAEREDRAPCFDDPPTPWAHVRDD